MLLQINYIELNSRDIECPH